MFEYSIIHEVSIIISCEDRKHFNGGDDDDDDDDELFYSYYAHTFFQPQYQCQ